MKKSLLLTLCALLPLCLSAGPRSIEQAQQLATDYLHSQSRHQAPAARQAALTHCHTAPQKNGQPAFYVFNRGTDDGFVIVSAESRTHTILGYSNDGHFDAATIPDNMRAWLEGYQEAIQYAASLPENKARANKPKRAPKSYTPIAPLCSTHWGQGNPYNLKCPTVGSNRCVTGCVATAAAQIMKYHNYPSTGKGSNSYYWYRSENDSVLLSANFGSTTYNWSQMTDTYTGSPTTAQKNAIATLMYHCGVSCYMDYGTNGSSAYSPNMLGALINNFRYNAGIQPILKDFMKEDAFLSAVIADLQAGRPVWFNGRTKSDEGHAFVCDGLDADGLVHINWGWYGSSDNYFRVSALDPEDQGTGGSSGNEAFTENVTAYTHIIPSEGGMYQPVITADSMYTTGTRFGRYDDICFNANNFRNQGLSYWEGSPAVQVYRNGSLYKTCNIDFTPTLDVGWYYYNIYFYPDFSTLPAGSYEIVPVVQSSYSTYSSTPTPILVKFIGEYRCQMTVTSDSIFLTLPEAEIPTDIPGQTAIPDPTQYTYAELQAYYYPEEDEESSFWNLQLTTADFYNSEAENQMCILFGVTSASTQSFAGSYLTDSMALYQCYHANMFNGNINSYQKVSSDEGEVTLVYHSNTDSYVLHYRIVAGNRTFVGQTEIAANNVWGGYGMEYGSHEEYETITLDHTFYTPLTTSKAMWMMDCHDVGWLSPIPYAIGGEITQLMNTPEQIANYKNCRLYISDGNTPLYAYNTKWLNNSNFTTGNEIQLHGKAVIVGQLKYYNSTTKEIQSGYFCRYEAPDSSSDTENIMPDNAGQCVQKVLRNGQIYIIRNGVTYTVDGKKP